MLGMGWRCSGKDLSSVMLVAFSQSSCDAGEGEEEGGGEGQLTFTDSLCCRRGATSAVVRHRGREGKAESNLEAGELAQGADHECAVVSEGRELLPEHFKAVTDAVEPQLCADEDLGRAPHERLHGGLICNLLLPQHVPALVQLSLQC